MTTELYALIEEWPAQDKPMGWARPLVTMAQETGAGLRPVAGETASTVAAVPLPTKKLFKFKPISWFKLEAEIVKADSRSVLAICKKKVLIMDNQGKTPWGALF